jgi:hypothetical protein
VAVTAWTSSANLPGLCSLTVTARTGLPSKPSRSHDDGVDRNASDNDDRNASEALALSTRGPRCAPRRPPAACGACVGRLRRGALALRVRQGPGLPPGAAALPFPRSRGLARPCSARAPGQRAGGRPAASGDRKRARALAVEAATAGSVPEHTSASAGRIGDPAPRWNHHAHRSVQQATGRD